MRLGVDCSNYTGELSMVQLQALLVAGVEFAIVGTQYPDIARQQIQALEAGGIEVPAVYCFLYWDGGDWLRVHDAFDFGKPVWLDCEYVANPMLSPQNISQQILDARSHCISVGLFAGIYTGAWWWPKYTNDLALDVPLWHAAYQSRPESLMLPHAYGGWTKAAIWQWSSSGIGGVNVDLNVMEDAVPDPTPTPPPQPTEVEALRALVRAGAIIAAGDQNLADLTEEDKSALDWIANTANGR